MFYLFKIYSHVSLLILLVSDKQGITIYSTSGKGLYLSVSNLLIDICLILDLFEYRPQNDLL